MAVCTVCREKAFEFTPTEYHLLNQVQTTFEPYFRLWTIFADFRAKREVWTTGPFMDLNSEEIERCVPCNGGNHTSASIVHPVCFIGVPFVSSDCFHSGAGAVCTRGLRRDVTEWWKTSYRLMKTFADESPAVAEVASLLRDATDEFKKRVPLIQALASPALKTRHWIALSDKIGACEGVVCGALLFSRAGLCAAVCLAVAAAPNEPPCCMLPAGNAMAVLVPLPLPLLWGQARTFPPTRTSHCSS